MTSELHPKIKMDVTCDLFSNIDLGASAIAVLFAAGLVTDGHTTIILKQILRSRTWPVILVVSTRSNIPLVR